MTGLDFAIIGGLFISAIIGILRGFTKEVLSLFTWGGAASLSYIFLPLGRSIVHGYISNPMMADGAAIFVLFLVSLIILSILSNIIAGYIRESSFGGIDRSLGFGFGILRGVILISAAELIFSTFTPRAAQSPTIQNARFIHMIRGGADTLLHYLPASLYDMVISQAAKVEGQVKSQIQGQMMQHGLHPFQGNGQTETQENPQVQPQIQPQGHQGPFPPIMIPSPQGPTAQNGPSDMVIINQGPSGQQPQVLPPVQSPPTNQTEMPRGLGQSVMPQDRQSTADSLARPQPQSVSTNSPEQGYTPAQLGDMERLIQTNGD